MRKFLALTATMALVATPAMAADLNISVESSGLNSIKVGPGDVVNFDVIGELTDALNEGIALAACDFAFTGGPLDPLVAGAGMLTFVRNDGITNPAGWCTPNVPGREGEEVQCGGGQNTILNFAGNAEFPVGAVVTGIAQPGSPELLMTGSLTAPLDDGVYVVSAFNCFGNVIKQGETGIPHWATEPFGEGTITNLTVEVTSCAAVAAVTGGNYACDDSLSRAGRNVLRIEFSIPLLAAPAPGEVEIRELLPAGAFGPDLSAQFVFSIENGNTLKIVETGEVLANETWYGITNTGAWCSAANFERDYAAVFGDANNNHINEFADLSAINANQSSLETTPDDSRFDINTVGGVSFADLSAANSFLNSEATIANKPTGHGCSP